MEEDYWEGNDELCDTETKELEIRNSERRPHVIEDALTESSDLLRRKKQLEELNWI